MTQLVFAREVNQTPERTLAPQPAANPAFGWTLLGWLGGAFAVVGSFDLVLAWFPFAFGNPQWEFGTVSAVLDGLPVFLLGLGLVLSATFATGKRKFTRVIAVALFALAAAIVALGVLYLTVVPIALQAVPDAQVRIGLFKAMGKTAVQLMAYPIVLVVIGRITFKATALRKVRIVNE